MARPASHSNDHASSLRNLKLLVVVLAASNILIGAFSVYLLRGVDRRYSELIDHTAPVLNDLQTSTAKAGEAMRQTNPAFFTVSADKIPSAVKRGRTALDADRALRSKLLSAEWLPETSAKRTEFRQSGEAFTQAGNKVLDLFAAGQGVEADRVREAVLRPAFERYQNATTKVADLLLDESKVTNDNFTARTSRLSTIVLSVASWPVLVLVLLLLVTAIFVVVMMIAFRGKDLADAP